MKITNEYNHFDEVYLISDSEQNKRVVVQINILPKNLIVYVLSCNGDFSEHYEEEMTKEKCVI